MNVLSIQSEVVYGHVGNSAARFVLQRLGHEVWAVPTVLYSNHPGHHGMRGEVMPTIKMRELIDGLEERGWLHQCDAVLSGYLGEPEHARLVAEAVSRVKALNPNAAYYCDPVFGDDDGAYAKPGVAEAMARDLIPIADGLFPNRFELQSLTARKITSAASALAAARSLGRPLVIATSIPIEEGIGTMAVVAGDAWLTSAPKLENAPHGTGDILSAAFLAHCLSGETIPAALERATSSVDTLIQRSVSAFASEIALVRDQDVLTRTDTHLKAKAL